MVSFPPLDELRTRRSAKWTLYDPDVLPMPVAEMDVELAGPVAAALHEAVDRSDTGYPGMDGALARAFAGFAGRRWGWDVDERRVRPASDVSAAAVDVLRAGTTPGGRAVLSSPVYPPFHRWPGSNGLDLIDVPVLADGDRFSLDLPRLEAEFRAGAAAYLLCQPHNPLGSVYGRAELAELADLALRHGVLVVADEIHAPLVLPGREFVPFLTVSDAARRTGVALHSASKAWNLAGLKSSVIVTAHPDTDARMAALPGNLAWQPGHFGVLASIAAYTEGEAWLDELVVALDDNHGRLQRDLASALPSARCVRADAGYLAWIDVSDCGYADPVAPATTILARGRVALGNGPDFGDTGRGFVRMNVGCAPELVSEGVRRMVAAL